MHHTCTRTCCTCALICASGAYQWDKTITFTFFTPPIPPCGDITGYLHTRAIKLKAPRVYSSALSPCTQPTNFDSPRDITGYLRTRAIKLKARVRIHRHSAHARNRPNFDSPPPDSKKGAQCFSSYMSICAVMYRSTNMSVASLLFALRLRLWCGHVSLFCDYCELRSELHLLYLYPTICAHMSVTVLMNVVQQTSVA